MRKYFLLFFCLIISSSLFSQQAEAEIDIVHFNNSVSYASGSTVSLHLNTKGIYKIDNKKYYLNFHEGDYEYYVNKYHAEDIKGNFEKTEIKLKTRDGGLNELIDIEINGIQFSYTYDTGAEVFDISPGLEKILIENGLIDNKDYYPPINSVDANGNITLTRRVKISGIKIGDYIVDNVVVTINQEDDDPLLFGRAILNKKFNNNVRWRPGLLTLYK